MKPVSTAFLALAMSGTLLAQAPANPQQNREQRGRGGLARLEAMDKDGDGRISSSEWQGAKEMFARLDSNNDGYLSREEVRQNRQQNATGQREVRNPRAMDANNDGKISRDEWNGPAEAFDRLDANHDGSITPEERPRGGRNAQNGQDGNRAPQGRGGRGQRQAPPQNNSR